MKNNNSIVTKDNARIGLKVKPGPDWEYYDQAKGSEYGTIIDITGGWCDVKWTSHSNANCYRISGEYDLCIYLEPLIKPEFEKEAKRFFKLNNLEKLTLENIIENKLEKWLINGNSI